MTRITRCSLLTGLALLLLSCGGGGGSSSGEASFEGSFRFIDWARDNDFEIGGSSTIRPVDVIAFDDAGARERVTKTEDTAPPSVDESSGELRALANGARPRIYLSLDRPASDANAIFLTLNGKAGLETPRIGWSGVDGDREIQSRGGLPLTLLSDGSSDTRTYWLSLDSEKRWRGTIRELYLQPGVSKGDTIRLSDVRVAYVPLSARWGELEGRESLVGRGQIGSETREMILAAPDSRIEVPMTLPEGARMELGYGVLPTGWRAPATAVTFQVQVTLESGDVQVVLDHTLDPVSNRDHRSWNRTGLSLADYAGQKIRLALVTKSPAGGGGPDAWEVPAVWTNPVVYAPRDPSDDDARPNLLLVSLDTLRADRLGSQGYPRSTSPALDRFAASNLQFANAYSHAASTGPSHMSLFTSLYPTMHGVTQQYSSLTESAETMAELMAAAGYHNEALTNGGYIRGELGFAQGFASYLDRSYNVDAELGRVDEMVDRTIEAMERLRDRPFFLFLQTYEVHAPYCPGEPFTDLFAPVYQGPLGDCVTALEIDRINHGCMNGEKLTDENFGADPPTRADLEHVVDLYDAGVRRTDRAMERLLASLEELGLAENTHVVFFADHGEDLGDHQDMGRHSRSLYDEIVHVPLLMRLPGVVSQPRLVESRIALMDLMPTLFELMDVPAIDAFRGVSLASVLRGEKKDAAPRDAVYAENFRHGTAVRLSLREGDYKMVRVRTDEVFGGSEIDWETPRMKDLRPSVELYDLSSDPGERRNLAEDEPERTKKLRAELDRLFREQSENALSANRVSIDEAARRRLKGLGYLRDEEKEEEE